jgi:hypothetical protein
MTICYTPTSSITNTGGVPCNLKPLLRTNWCPFSSDLAQTYARTSPEREVTICRKKNFQLYIQVFNKTRVLYDNFPVLPRRTRYRLSFLVDITITRWTNHSPRQMTLWRLNQGILLCVLISKKLFTRNFLQVTDIMQLVSLVYVLPQSPKTQVQKSNIIYIKMPQLSNWNPAHTIHDPKNPHP